MIEIIYKIFYAFYAAEIKNNRGLPALNALLPAGLIGTLGSWAVLFFIEWTLSIDIMFSFENYEAYSFSIFLLTVLAPYFIFYFLCISGGRYVFIEEKYKKSGKDFRLFKYWYAICCLTSFVFFGYLRFKNILE